ncbi:MAG: hypothetical protein IT321_28500 [Anaerolineae bacterium]|nr:hypothetical protein [Anaerolineae bacterium]
MESVVAAFIMIFLSMFSVLTLASSVISSHDSYQSEMRALESRISTQSRTRLSQINARTVNSGTVVQTTYVNDGGEKITDFDTWDVIVQYYDTAVPSNYYTTWMPYEAGSPASNEWTIKGIYADAKREIEEIYDPGILNPGEEMVIEAYLPHTVAPASQVQVTLAVSNGMNLSGVFVRNTPPVLDTNLPILIASGGMGVINESVLKTTDVDNDNTELIYTVTVPPAQGTLNLDDTFTGFDLYKDRLHYEHTGTGSDSFTFTVSDGQDVIGAYVFLIDVSEPPQVTANTGLTLPTNTTAPITNTMLAATDVDNTANELIYTVTVLPTQGSISMTTFTQADIDNGNFTYTHVGAGPDSFLFTVSDGVSEIGPFTFNISVN